MKSVLLLILFTLPFSVMAQNYDEQRIERLVRDAKVIVVAEAVDIGEAPGVWAGVFLFAQRVKYEVKEVLKGDLAQGRICVCHYIVHYSVTADKTYPRLSSTIFAKGNRLVLFLAPDPHPEKGYIEMPGRKPMCGADEPSFVVPEVNYGAMLAEENILKSIRQAISSK